MLSPPTLPNPLALLHTYQPLKKKLKNRVMPGPVVVWSGSICGKIQLKYLIQ